ncbi:major capsid protein [Tortoise microvirus 100]|nr:major capsid protein [Tortoise microvirus 100]
MKKSKFNLTHLHSTTLDMGYLVPFLTLDCLPNDTFKISMNSFVRAQPMLAPLMHEVYLYTQYWYVPYRILWDNWVNFITNNPDNQFNEIFPYINTGESNSVGSLFDYFGVPVNKSTDTTKKFKNLKINALPFRAYAEIYNTRYRDEDLQQDVAISYEGGLDEVTNTNLLRNSWKKDYFTTARTSTQRGGQVAVPVSHFASGGDPINVSVSVNSVLWVLGSSFYNDYALNFTINSITFDPSKLSDISAAGSFFTWTGEVSTNATTFNLVDPKYRFITVNVSRNTILTPTSYNKVQLIFNLSYVSTDQPVSTDPLTLILDTTKTTQRLPGTSGDTVIDRYITKPEDNQSFAVVSTSSTQSFFNIRDLRLSSALQRFKERSLQWGNRYEEFIEREFGIKPRDARIQRPEYLGGGKSMLQISEVLQTSEGNNTGVGTMRGHGVATMNQRPIRFTSPEHGIVLGLMSIRPKAVYTQGLDKFWLKNSQMDYFLPELANVGMQEVLEPELYATEENTNFLIDPSVNYKIFGYQNRYSDYRSIRPRVTGEFRDILNYWNLARDFENAPVLNSSFIEQAPSKRIFAEQTQNSFLCMLRNNIQAFRPIPKVAKNILK